jgi:hypothetical protein
MIFKDVMNLQLIIWENNAISGGNNFLSDLIYFMTKHWIIGTSFFWKLAG